MPANFRPTGAIEHYVKFRHGTTRYLGTATLAPEIEVRPAWIDIKNDLGGRTVPMDKVRDREQHVISTTLNRFDWDTYKALQGLGVGSSPAAVGETDLTHGTLTFGSSDFELALVYRLFGTSGTPADTPQGRRYYSCVLLGARESTVGTRIMEVALVVEANQLFIPATRLFSFYSEVAADVTAGLPAVE